jgi:hypothetical protein
MVSDAPGQVSRDAIQAVLTRIGAAWTELTGVLDAIPDEREEEPGVTGEWSVKDVAGHIAFWIGHDLANAERILRGEPVHVADWADINEQEVAKRAGLAPGEVRAELERNHARLISLLSELQPDHPAAADVLGMVEEDATGHIYEHLTEIRAWWNRTSAS